MEDEFQDVQIYPNPTNSEIHLKGFDGNIHLIEMVDVLGKIVYASSKFDSSILIDVSYLNEGIYFLKLKMEKGTVVKKIIINK